MIDVFDQIFWQGQGSPMGVLKLEILTHYHCVCASDFTRVCMGL